MKLPSDRVRAARRVRGRGAAGAALALVGAIGGAAAAGAQPPAPPDTAARADSTRRAAADSAARDSAVARALGQRPGATVFEQLGVDRLRLSTVGAAVGLVWPRRVSPARLYAVHADYGEVAPAVRLVFESTYWRSRFTANAVRGFERAVARASGVDSVRVDRFRASDLTLGTDLRWWPRDSRAARRGRADAAALRPFVGGGLAVHFLDVEGVPLNDTFVEQALDGVALGLAGTAGLDARLFPNVTLTMHARYDLFGGAHFASLRAGASYRFDASDPARGAARGAR